MSGARLLTPRGPAGIAVVELSGPASLERLAALGVAPPPEGAVRLARLVHDGRPLDEALVVRTAPDVVELHLHGSPPLVDEVLGLCGGAPEDEPAGIEARALARLAGAPSAAGARLLLDQAEGALRAALEALARDPDAARAGALVARGRRARYLFEPARVVLAGPVNAGKSTLFNALVGQRRVAVHARAGTTRDAIQARVLLGPWPVDLVDTAGARPVHGDEASARVERAGQRTAEALVADAELVLRLFPADGPPPTGGAPAAREVQLPTCADRPGSAAPGAISALVDPAHARRVVEERFAAALGLEPADAWVAGRAVPFEEGQLAALEALIAGDAQPLARLLDGGAPRNEASDASPGPAR